MAIIKDLENSFTNRDDKYFFDTNVWLFIHYSSINAQNRENQQKQKVYSKKFQDITSVQGNIFIHSTTILEIIKVILEDQFKKFKIKLSNKNLDYKLDFRPTKEFERAKDTAFNVIQEILKDAKLIKSNIDDTENILNLLKLFKDGKESDLNDLIYLDICFNDNITFISDDIDCLNYNKNVNVLTNNSKLIKKYDEGI